MHIQNDLRLIWQTKNAQIGKEGGGGGRTGHIPDRLNRRQSLPFDGFPQLHCEPDPDNSAQTATVGYRILTTCGCHGANSGFSGTNHAGRDDGGGVGSAGNRLSAYERLEVNRLV